METTVWLFLAIAGLLAYIFVLGLFEVYYFITLGLTAFVARFFKKRTHIMDMTSVTRKWSGEISGNNYSGRDLSPSEPTH